jgi:integrase
MAIRKHNGGKVWYADITIGGKRHLKSCKTTDRRQAQEYHDRLKAELWRESALGEQRSPLWQEAVIAYVEAKSSKASIETDKVWLRWLEPKLNGKRVNEITTALLQQIQRDKQAEGSSNATCNRVMSAISQVLNHMRKAGLLAAVPYIPKMGEPKERIRWITRDEWKRLYLALPPHLKPLALFSVETGLRQHNAAFLEWEQVDLERRQVWIHADQTKARKAIAIPLSTAAHAVLLEQQGKHERWAFPYRNKPMNDPGNTAWKKACKAAGIESFRWHDLRHTWATWHVQAGTPLEVLQKLGGWSQISMVLRYAHFSADHLAKFANNTQERKVV